MRILSLFFTFFILATTAYCQSNLSAVAEAGDGVYTLLRRHGLNPTEHMAHFLELNQDKLDKDKSLKVGQTYLLPIAAAPGAAAPEAPATPTATATATSSPSVLSVPLFGPKYATVTVKDQRLKGAVYYLISGHGGPDPGAVGKYGSYLLAEDEYAYDVTIRLARRLMEHGATVYMIIQDPKDGIRDQNILTLDKDEVAYPNLKIPLNQTARLRQRVDVVNRLHANHKGAYQRMLSIHVDSRSESQNIDVFFYHHETSKEGEKLAKNIHTTFIDKYKRYQPNRDYFGSVTHRSSLYVLKYTQVPSVFIELGNIRNTLDQRRFVIPNNRQALSNWICEGLMEDYVTKTASK